MPKFESTLHLSKYFAVMQLIILAGSLIGVCYIPCLVWVKTILIMVVLGCSIQNFYSQMQWQAIGQDVNGWYLKKAGEKLYVTFLGQSTVTSMVSILCFSEEGKYLKQSCMIFKDAMPSDRYRQLVVMLSVCHPREGGDLLR